MACRKGSSSRSSTSARLQEEEIRAILPVFSKPTCQVTKSTFAARQGWRWPLLYTSLQERCSTYQAAP